MTVDEFIKENITSRIEAADKLKSDIRVNDIHVKAGYDAEHGLEVQSGIEHLAEMFDAEIKETTIQGTTISVIERSIIVLGIKLYSNEYVPNKDGDSCV